METASESFESISVSSKHVAQRLLTIGENRLQLLAVEVQEERERILQALFLALGIAVFGLLAGMALTATIVVLFWGWSPVTVLLSLTAFYGAAGILLGCRLKELLRDWRTLSASLGQLQKDRTCLEKIFD